MTQSPKVRPEDIRAEVGVITFAESERGMVADALEIADSCARSDIECHCHGQEGLEDIRWYETDSKTLDDIERPPVEQAIRYLDARGLLIRHTTRPTWVRFVEVAG